MISNQELEVVHSKEFIKRIHKSKTEIATAAEVFAIVFLPLSLINKHLLTPLKWQVSGSILAGKVALDIGWSINLGGGFHHCSHDSAGEFCLFADLTLLIHYLWNEVDHDLNILIVDLDAHQRNGYARDVLSLGQRKKSTKESINRGKQFLNSVHTNASSSISRSINLKTTKSVKDGKKLKSDQVYHPSH